MPSYTIELTDTEDLALHYAADAAQNWIDNLVHERCRIAIDEIIAIAVKKCLDAGIPIPGTREEIVGLAFQNNWVIKLKDTPKPAL
jgi:hypothetical protein